MLLTFTGQAFGQADEKSDYCKWPDDWRTTGINEQGHTVGTTKELFNDLDGVENNRIRFNSAEGPATVTDVVVDELVFPAPLCDWDNNGTIDTAPTAKPDDFFRPKIKCGAANTEVTESTGTLIGSATSGFETSRVTWAEDATDGRITLTFTPETEITTAKAVSCTLEIDWVGSNDDDGPIEYAFQVAIVPNAFAAPTLVRALAETRDSAYVEWTQVAGTDTADMDDDPSHYVITATSTTMGARKLVTETIKAEVIPFEDPEADPQVQVTDQRQGARIDGLTSGADYTITVRAQLDATGTKDDNMGRTSAAATAGLTTGPAAISTVTLLRGYWDPPEEAGATPVDHTFVLSMGESVEIDPQTYLLNMALHGRDDFGQETTDTTTTPDVGGYAEYVRGDVDNPVELTYTITSNAFVETLYISTDPNMQTDDLIRLKGLKEGTPTLTLMAMMNGMTVARTTMRVKVLEKITSRALRSPKRP